MPAFPRTAAGPPPFVPLELSSEELWHAADAVRRHVEADPDALAEVRAALDPWRTSCGPRPTTSLHAPGRWAAAGASWGGRALHALRACIH